jgi:general secretion pathway protein A
MAEALMYKEFYGLRERPFTLIPDPDFLYLSPQHKLARAYLEYGLTQRLGFIVLTGEVGTGKTTLIKSLLKSAGRKQRIGVIYQTSFGAEDLLELLLREFGIKGHFTTRVARLAAFNQFLLNAYARQEHVVLIVDEAQNLGPEALEELRLLSNLQTEKEPLLQVILVGQTALQERLRHPALMQLAQRVSVQYHLNPLDHKETREYVVYRLARAGGSGIFTDSALDKLFDYTKGVPRRLNTCCDLALVAGFAEGRREIDGEFIDTVMATQGIGVETLGPSAAPAAAPTTEPEPGYRQPAAPRPTPAHDGLGLAVAELSSRLSRLEGLALELYGQMLPVLRQLLGKPPPPAPEQILAAESPGSFPSDQESDATDAAHAAGGPYRPGTTGASKDTGAAGGSESAGAAPPKSPGSAKSWWSKIRGR